MTDHTDRLPEFPSVVFCPYCDHPHESVQSASHHAAKMQDETHTVDDLHVVIVKTVRHNDRADRPEPPTTGVGHTTGQS